MSEFFSTYFRDMILSSSFCAGVHDSPNWCLLVQGAMKMGVEVYHNLKVNNQLAIFNNVENIINFRTCSCNSDDFICRV
jgi:hypothetical protein